MTLGQEIAKLLIESGTAYTVAMLAKHFNRSHNAVTSSLTTVRRNCMLNEVRKSSPNGTPQFWYSSLVSAGCGLLAMAKPHITCKPYFINDPFHHKYD